jgi:proline dehydrogenase
MLRESLLYLSQSHTAQRVVTGTPVSRRLAERFVAGETLDDAMRAARATNEAGLSVSLDYLGEAVGNREEAEQATEMAIRILERIAEEGVDSNVSVKPTQLGLGIDVDLCRANLVRVLERARGLGKGGEGIFVRLDMESGEYTERTVETAEWLWVQGFRNVGTVLQSYLRRTPEDIGRLNALGMRVRLVKGAYRESPEIAYQEKETVDRLFVDEMRMLLEDGVYPAIATHDEAMIDATRRFAFERGVRKDAFEFQMLYGIRRDLQQRLREEGYHVRVYIPFGESWYPYLMRRMAERPANLFFVTRNILRESPAARLANPVAIGAGVIAGSLAALAWRGRRNGH